MSFTPQTQDPNSLSFGLRPAIRTGVFGAVTYLISAFTSWRTKRHNYAVANELLELDDAMLRDIGLTPDDIHAALRNTEIDPTLQLSRVSAMRRMPRPYLVK